MQTIINKRPVAGIAPTTATPVRRTRSDNDLISLAAPTLDVVLQIRAGQVKPSNDLRRNIAELLKEMEERGVTLRYADNQVQAVKFALAAFVDETVLTADFPLRDEWEKNPLQLEYFGEHLAGVKYFDRLDEMLKAPEVNADVIEVYYLCLLLGYKGKYKIYMEEQLKGVIEHVAETLRRVGRLQTGDLSPHWRVTDQPEPPKEDSLPLWFKVGGGAAVFLLIVFYMVIYLLLDYAVKDARGQFVH